MRIVIKNNNNILGNIIRVPEWFCEQECIDNHTASIESETELAVLLDFGDKQVCVPRSIIKLVRVPNKLNEWN